MASRTKIGVSTLLKGFVVKGEEFEEKKEKKRGETF